MDRLQKINTIKLLKEEIDRQHLIIENEKKKLQILNKELSKASNSNIPILLFVVDETIPMPDRPSDYKYEYVYYCPDIDDMRFSIKYSPVDYLPNFVDMRDFFKEMKMPSRMQFGRGKDFFMIVEYSVQFLKDIIDDVFASYEINSWEELGNILKALPDHYVTPKYEDMKDNKTLKLIKQ